MGLQTHRSVLVFPSTWAFRHTGQCWCFHPHGPSDTQVSVGVSIHMGLQTHRSVLMFPSTSAFRHTGQCWCFHPHGPSVSIMGHMYAYQMSPSKVEWSPNSSDQLDLHQVLIHPTISAIHYHNTLDVVEPFEDYKDFNVLPSAMAECTIVN